MIPGFEIAVLESVSFTRPAIAIAAMRAGAAGVLDLEYCSDDDLLRAPDSFTELKSAPDQSSIGLHLRCDQLQWLRTTDFHRGVALLIVNIDQIDDNAVDHLAELTASRTLIEVTSVEQAHAFGAAGGVCDGWVARGSECGGPIGDDTTLTLLQRLTSELKQRVWVRGALGPHATAACRMAGAVGVVLDDQCLLLRESPIPKPWREELASSDGSDAIPLSDADGRRYRILVRPRLAAASELQDRLFNSTPNGRDDSVRMRVGWGSPDELAWPIGQGLELARTFQQRFRTVGRLIQAYRERLNQRITTTDGRFSLDQDSPLAKAYDVRFPIVQGPMTRVSDVAAFATAVADHGALPTIALALKGESEARSVLVTTAKQLGKRSWGVGILGFVPAELRDQQLRVIEQTRPRFAILAGGRPEQAQQLENVGVAAFVHVSTVTVLTHFLDRGIRRFVFEGRECGGHVGPLPSLLLWEQAVDTLIGSGVELKEIEVLFAGGIHNAVTSATVATLAAPLSDAGARIGILMGTAYLLTEEAVSTGAIQSTFQSVALQCAKTVCLDAGGGHANRCAITPFAEQFQQARLKLMAAGNDQRQQLEDLTLGRLRLAAKGTIRDENGELMSRDADEQFAHGMYLLGSLATLRHSTLPMSALHQSVTIDAAEQLSQAKVRAQEKMGASHRAPVDVAIVGVSALLPGADNVEQFWHNVLSGHETISEIPPDRWDWQRYSTANSTAPDEIESHWGGFFNDISFDPTEYGIPPVSMNSISVSHLLGLELTKRAVHDAGYELDQLDRKQTAVILANSDLGGFLGHLLVTRTTLPLVQAAVPAEVLERLPDYTEESFAGTLTNVAAGRIANRFDFGGPNYSIDAACASSLIALDAATQELANGNSNVAIVGGVDTGQTPQFYVAFSKTQALSKDGKARCFDQDANGIVISEGVVFMVLKRLTDAERDGDRIYGVVKSVGCSSDGKGMSMTAPRSEGQMRAVRRAFDVFGASGPGIGLYEAHGTGTPVGDRTEALTISQILQETAAPPQSCALGSVKSILGHTKTAAGLVGLLKATLALHYRTLPPHAGVNQPLETFADPDCPLMLLDQAMPWLKPANGPRRAGVSAFGFGGTNAHAVVEEYSGHPRPIARGSDHHPVESIVFRSRNAETLRDQVQRLLTHLARAPLRSISDLAYTQSLEVGQFESKAYAGFVATDVQEAQDRLTQLLAALDGSSQALPSEMFFDLHSAAPVAPKLAFVFPGQGTQYLNMGRQMAQYFEPFAEALEEANRQLAVPLCRPLTDIAWLTNSFFDQQAKAHRDLADTRYAQPALAAVSEGYLRLLQRLGVQSDMCIGHSFGELPAMRAAGAIDFSTLLGLAEARGRLMSTLPSAGGAMLAVSETRQTIEHSLRAHADLVIANDNAPRQVVVSGPSHAIATFAAELDEKQIACVRLPVSAAFHSPQMSPVHGPFGRVVEQSTLTKPIVPVCTSTEGVAQQPETLKRALVDGVVNPVDFVASIRHAFDAGVRLFIEVGPGSTLRSLITKILPDQDISIVSLDAGKGGLKAFHTALIQLHRAGVSLKLNTLYEDRRVQKLNVGRSGQASKHQARPPGWIVNGNLARPLDAERSPVTQSPLYDQRSATQAVLQHPSSRPEATIEGHDDRLEAYLALQRTMREVIATAERTAIQFLDHHSDPAMPLTIDRSSIVEPAAQLDQQSDPAQMPAKAAETPPDGSTLLRQTGETDGDWHRRLVGMLISEVAERTGYPAEMIGPTMNLEADLGIDSIKRMELMAGLDASADSLDTMQAELEIESLLRCQSLDEIATALQQQLDQDEINSAKRGNGQMPTANDAITDCPRYLMKESTTDKLLLPSEISKKFVLISSQPTALALTVSSLLEEQGIANEIVDASTQDDQLLAWLIANLRVQYGPITSVLHISGPLGVTQSSVEAWHIYRRCNESLFRILKICSDDFVGDSGAFVVAASSMDGRFGRGLNGGQWSPLSGASVGLLNALKKECIGLDVRAVDFEPSAGVIPIAKQLLLEVLVSDGPEEVGYVAGQRHAFSCAAKETVLEESPRLELSEDWVMLVTGGGNGITGENLASLVKSGMRLHVVGRTPVSDEPDDLSGLDSREELRRYFLEQADQETTPAVVEEKVSSVLRKRTIARNLARLREAGTRVTYHSTDVTDAGQFSQLIESIYAEDGRIDAVIHGAGVIEDRRLADKTLDSYNRVFDTKVESARVLHQTLRPETLKLVVFFSSIAGRVGNAGQTDYAAANEVLNRMALRMKADWPDVRVMSINWGPWTGTGMVREETEKLFRSHGIQPIDVAAGCEFLKREIHYGRDHEVEVIAGAGPWAEA